MAKEKLLLFSCCAPCAIYPTKLLQERFDLVLFFYGPNIHPEEEYKKRLESVELMALKLKVPLVELGYDTAEWHLLVKNLDKEPEGGKRCSVCYKMRLEKTAEFARKNGYRYFGATLTLSPHKSASIINLIGESIAKEKDLIFLSEDFKKHNGFKKSCEMSKEYGLYRQKYCGCEFSLKRRVHMVKEFTDSNFSEEVLNTKGVVLVDVFANWCGPCKALSPVVTEISEQYKDRIKVGKLDVDKNPNTPGKYNILSVPTLLFFKDGKLADTQIGLISKQALEKKLVSL